MKAAVIGSFVVDLMARTPHLPEPGETVKGSFFRSGPGGKGFNQAVAAWRSGCELTFSTKLGADSFAEIGRAAMRQDQMPEEYVFVNPDAPTAAALISVDEQTSQNEIVVVLGANATYDDNDIAKLDQALEGCEYLLMQLEINLDALEKLVNLAYSKGIKVILNPAPVQALPDSLYQKLYLVTPNEVEAKILTGIPYETDADCPKIAEAFLKKGVQKVILTLGKRGAYVHDGQQDRFLNNFPVEVLDTTGAGDAFNGGLLAALSKGKNLFDAAAYGNVVSNLAVTRLGTAPAMPYAEETEAFLQQHGLYAPEKETE